MSGLPYKFEPGMRVLVAESAPGIVTGINAYGDVSICHDGSLYLWSRASCMADLDHPGTRGLLLQQYRDASGHADAVAVRDNSDGDWIVDSDPSDSSGHVGGLGESEGAAILDALTRLAAERARESEQETQDERLAVILAQTQAAVAKLARRLDAVEGALGNERLARIEARLRRIEDGHV